MSMRSGLWPRTRSSARNARTGGTELAVVVVVDGLGDAVEACRERYDPGARGGMPPHVTVLYPVPSDDRTVDLLQDTLSQVLVAHQPFSFRLRTIGEFPGVVYLAPEPAAPFVRLTEDLSSALGIAPYGGRFDTVVPHLTVAQHRVPRRVMRVLEAALPIEVRANEVRVFGQVDGTWSQRCAVSLGTGADHALQCHRHPRASGSQVPGADGSRVPGSGSAQPLQEQ